MEVDRLVSNDVREVPLLVRSIHIRVHRYRSGMLALGVATTDEGEKMIAQIFLCDVLNLLDANKIPYRSVMASDELPDFIMIPDQAANADLWIQAARGLACDPPAVIH